VLVGQAGDGGTVGVLVGQAGDGGTVGAQRTTSLDTFLPFRPLTAADFPVKNNVATLRRRASSAWERASGTRPTAPGSSSARSAPS
jgi:hypothetical protein